MLKMAVAKLIVLLLVVIFIQQSPKLYASDDLEPETVRASSLPTQLNELRLELRNAVKENEVRKLEDILGRFKAVEAPDSEWEAFATEKHCVRWSSRQSWQDTVNLSLIHI
jgi:hypothetical protein